MSFEAESNSELTMIVPAYQLHFRFPVQSKIHKQKLLSDIRTAILGSIAGPCYFMPALSDGPTNFKKSGYIVFFNSIFSSPESKARLTFSDRKASVVRPSVHIHELLHCSVTCDLFSIFEYQNWSPYLSFLLFRLIVTLLKDIFWSKFD